MKSIKRLILVISITLVLILPLITIASPAFADTESYSGWVSFTSGANPGDIDLPSFDTMGGTRTLQSVTVWFYDEAAADLVADNDDIDDTGTVIGRVIRWWSGTGPGVNSGTVSHTATTSPVDLGLEDGDGLLVDPNPLDGTDFGGAVSYPNTLDGPYNPTAALYSTVGPSTVTFTITPELWVNDLQWVTAPDDWQLQVRNQALNVTVNLDYEYQQQGAGGAGATSVPVFPTMYIGIVAALGAGVLAYLYRRKALGRKS